jgi:3-oxoacyl-[acyl-carrier protein] reductase
MNLDLINKKALVFGASTGIGRKIAEIFLAEGAQLAAASRSLEKLSSLNKSPSITATLITGDLSIAGEATRITNQAISKLGGLDILVINTGGPPKGGIESIESEQWHSAMQNLWFSTLDAIKAALPVLKQSGHGRIILIASTTAKEPIAQMIVSNSIRSGLLGMLKGISSEMSPFGITANAILPGYINTDRLKELGNTEAELIKQIPAGRLGTTMDLAALALFLASDLSSYITGQMITVDGGRSKSF